MIEMSKTTKKKRTIVPKDKKFAIIETLQGDVDVLVELIPNVWFITEKKQTIKVRQSAKCYYPRQMENQTIDQYLKHLKHAKFECLKPANDNKWKVLECKVLKKGIASFTEAVDAEKFFSDYLNTTDAEAKIREQASPPKRLRKTKKATVQTPCESESDDEGGKVSAKVPKITDYNATFRPVTQKEFDSESMTVDGPTDINQANHSAMDNIFRISAEQLPNLNIDLDIFSEIVDVEVNKTLIPDSVIRSTSDDPDQIANIGLEESPQVVFEFLEPQQITSSKSNCNCCQKAIEIEGARTL